MKKARLAGTMPDGTRVFRIPVRVEVEGQTFDLDVLAPSSSDAANWARDRIVHHDARIRAWGPKGGVVCRTHGDLSFAAAILIDGQPPMELDEIEAALNP